MCSRESWRTGDLVVLHEALRITIDIENCEKILKKDGLLIIDHNGVTREHPATKIIASFRAQRQSIMRGLGLTVSTSGQASVRLKNAAITVADEMATKRAKARPNLLAVLD